MPDLLNAPPKLNLTDVVMKIDRRRLAAWLQDLRKVLPAIPSRDGLVLTKDDRPLFRFLLNSAGGGLTPTEAYAFTGILTNLLQIVDAAQSQQADFVLVRRMLQTCLLTGHGLSPAQATSARKLLEDTSYIEG